MKFTQVALMLLSTVEAFDRDDTMILKHKTDRQSPIDVDTTADDTVITSDVGFGQHYGNVSISDLNSPNKGHSLQVSFPESDVFFASDLTKQWFPDTTFKFTAKQFHFHAGHGAKTNYTLDNGSEDTTNGDHHNLEMHIVHTNDDKNTTKDFLASVTAILFDVNHTMTEPSFADTFFEGLLGNNSKSQSFDDDFMAYVDMDHRYVFRGSLTTPPYSEYLFWTLIPKVIQIQPSTLRLFDTKMFNKLSTTSPVGEENRDVQALNNRTIYYVDLATDDAAATAAFSTDVEVAEVTQSSYTMPALSFLALGALSLVVYKQRKTAVQDD